MILLLIKKIRAGLRGLALVKYVRVVYMLRVALGRLDGLGTGEAKKMGDPSRGRRSDWIRGFGRREGQGGRTLPHALLSLALLTSLRTQI